MDYKLELLCIPVSDVDAAKEFYVDKVGFTADHDQRVDESLRFVQLTPPGSGCSICIGEGLTTMAAGSLEGLQLVVDDAQQAHAELSGRGVEVSEIDDQPWGRFVHFSDPDGNSWNIQEIKRAGS
jgi:catechol 2,3-dioxygenase-like lactoylglutathione lyase family enzyme